MKEDLDPDDFELYHNSPEFDLYRKIIRQGQIMMAIVRVLFWLTMAGLVAFVIWLLSLPPSTS